MPKGYLYFVIEGEFEVLKTITSIKEDNRAWIDFKSKLSTLLTLLLTY